MRDEVQKMLDGDPTADQLKEMAFRIITKHWPLKGDVPSYTKLESRSSSIIDRLGEYRWSVKGGSVEENNVDLCVHSLYVIKNLLGYDITKDDTFLRRAKGDLRQTLYKLR